MFSLRQRLVEDDLVEPVEELGAELLPQQPVTCCRLASLARCSPLLVDAVEDDTGCRGWRSG
jgi:hypothetical protein